MSGDDKNELNLPEGYALVPLEALMDEPEPEEPQANPRTLVNGMPPRDPKALHPLADARLRRHQKDSSQLSWDNETDPEQMVAAILGDADLMTHVSAPRVAMCLGEVVSQCVGGNARAAALVPPRALRIAGVSLRKGNVAPAREILKPVAYALKDIGGIDRVICRAIAIFHPSAPEAYVERR